MISASSIPYQVMDLPRSDSNLSLDELELDLYSNDYHTPTEFEVPIYDRPAEPPMINNVYNLEKKTGYIGSKFKPTFSAKKAFDSGSRVVDSNCSSLDLEGDYLTSDGDLPSYAEATSGGGGGHHLSYQPFQDMTVPGGAAAQLPSQQTNSSPASLRQVQQSPTDNQMTPANRFRSNPSYTGTRPKVAKPPCLAVPDHAASGNHPYPSPTDNSHAKPKKLVSSPPGKLNSMVSSSPSSGLKVDLGSSPSRTKTKPPMKSQSTSTSRTSKPSKADSSKSSSCSTLSSVSVKSADILPSDGSRTYNISTGDYGVVSYNISFAGHSDITVNNNIGISPHVSKSAGKKSNRRSPPQGLHIPAAGSKRRIRQEDIEVLARKLGDDWLRVGLSIGIDKGQLENIRYRHERTTKDQTEMTRDMFKVWKGVYGHNATINYVIDALTDPVFGLYEVAACLPKDPPH